MTTALSGIYRARQSVPHRTEEWLGPRDSQFQMPLVCLQPSALVILAFLMRDAKVGLRG